MLPVDLPEYRVGMFIFCMAGICIAFAVFELRVVGCHVLFRTGEIVLSSSRQEWMRRDTHCKSIRGFIVLVCFDLVELAVFGCDI